MLFKGGTLVTGQGIQQADLRVSGEHIQEIGTDLAARPGEKVYDISGKLVLPGVIDAHTHFLLKSRNTVTADDAYSGSVAAVQGGVTTVIDYADQLPDKPLLAGVEARRRDFVTSAVDYSFHLVVNDNYQPHHADQFAQLQEAGIASVKLFTTYKEANYLLPQAKWLSILEACRKYGLVVTVHAEDDVVVEEAVARGKATNCLEVWDHPDLRPAQAEVAAVQQVIELAKASQCPMYIVHISTGTACRLLWEAREAQVPILGETTPHYLLLERDILEGTQGRNHLMTPPLRQLMDNRILWQGVEDGTMAVIATDHCAYTPEQKAQGKTALDILPGIPGVETLLPLVYSHGVAQGRIDLPRMVQLLAENPARIFGLWPRKGSLQCGTDADLVIYNPLPRWELTNADIHSRAGYSSFAGLQIQGKVELTLLRGQVLMEQGEFLGSKAGGQFVPAGKVYTNL